MTDRTMLLQTWVTIGSAGPAVTQDVGDWIDASGFADCAFWIDVTNVTPPGGTNTNAVGLVFETSPSTDESYFTPCAGQINLGTALPFLLPAATPFVRTSVQSTQTVSLSRYVRWRLTPVGAGAWSVTFRVRVVANRSGNFTPTTLPGCVLWLRSDLGVTLVAGTLTTWADQSGNGNTATAVGVAVPTYANGGGLNNLPRFVGTGSGYMTGAMPSVTDHTVFAVVTYPTLANRAAFAGTNAAFNVNSGFAQFTETPTGVLGRAGASAALFATAVSGDTSTLGLGKPNIYSTMAASNSTVDVFINGISSATAATAFGLGTCPKYVLFALDNTPQYPFNTDTEAYEYIVFNRALSTTERLRIHRYLGARYGIAVP